MIIAGLTESGKTTLALELVHAKRHKEQAKVLVLDPNFEDWDCDFITDDADEFMEVAKNEESCYLVVDESGESLDKYDRTLNWLGTRSRHWGHRLILITHEMTLIAKAIRGQCSDLFAFEMNAQNAREWALLFNDDYIREASKLSNHEYIFKRRGFPAVRQKLLL